MTEPGNESAPAELSFVVNRIAHASVHADGCSNRGGPFITIGGDLVVGGLHARFIFRNNVKGRHTAQDSRDVAIILAGTEIVLPKQPSRGLHSVITQTAFNTSERLAFEASRLLFALPRKSKPVLVLAPFQLSCPPNCQVFQPGDLIWGVLPLSHLLL